MFYRRRERNLRILFFLLKIVLRIHFSLGGALRLCAFSEAGGWSFGKLERCFLIMNSSELREKIAFYLNDSATMAGKMVDLALLAVNIVACALYVAGTYSEAHRLSLVFADAVVAVIFFVDYVLRIYSTDKKWKYIFSFYGVIDLVSILPSIATAEGLVFLRVLKVLRILRFLRFLENGTFFFGKISKFRLQVFRTIFTVFTILFVSAGFIYYSESSNPDSAIRTFGESFYFTVTTLSTVGFGDFVPTTSMGMFFTAVMIMGGAIMIPWEVGKLIRMLLLADTGKIAITCSQCGLTGHDPDASHCKACGHVIFQKYDGDLSSTP
jgi:voltage-gated potassium channel